MCTVLQQVMIRRKANCSTIAQATGINISTVWRLATGKTAAPAPAHARAIALFLKQKPSRLWPEVYGGIEFSIASKKPCHTVAAAAPPPLNTV